MFAGSHEFAWGAFLVSLPVTAATVLLAQAVTFAVARRLGKHSVVDVTWGLGFALIAVVSFFTARGVAYDFTTIDAGDPPPFLRPFLALGLTVAWGLRLATHIALRSRGHGEDPRYEELMANAPGNRPWHAFTRIYLTQGAVMWLVSLPVQLAMFEVWFVGWVAWVGVALWALGMFFETVGDWQLTRFRNDPSKTGQVLDTGLWRYTRHPNYFGDACVWWGLFLLAADAWPGVLTVFAPLVMTWLLAKGTGKPLLEKDMAARRPGYVDYVRRTSGFVPLPPKRGSSTPPAQQTP
jgi:steroid 5-alpha reductase family enzyme